MASSSQTEAGPTCSSISRPLKRLDIQVSLRAPRSATKLRPRGTAGRQPKIFASANYPPMTLQKTAFEADVICCVRCDRKAELMLSITSPKDGRTLRIFRCECGKLTSADNHRPK